jgi:tRNA(Ile)-lysidine synthase
MPAPQPSAPPEPAARGPDAAGLDLLELTAPAFARRLDRSSRAPIAVAFSGGGDSLALLLAARAWARQAGRPLLALTVDHRLQAGSRAFTEHARRTAEALGVPFRSLEWRGEKPANGVPAAARRARHGLLADAAREAGAAVILMGHTADDLAEARLMRASGSSVGLAREWSPSPAWPEGRGVFLLRPLLGASRAGLRRILSASGLGWIEDPANDDLRYARARARRSESALSPDGDGGFDRAPAAWSPDLALDGQAVQAGVLRLDRVALSRIDASRLRRVIAAACVSAGGAETLPRRQRLERLAARIAGAEDGVATLAGARIEAGPGLQFMRDAGAQQDIVPLTLSPDRAEVWDGRFLVWSETAAAVRPLRGLAARLPAAERAALRRIPAGARGALPVFQIGEIVTCPILAQGALARARGLIGDRFAGACGRFAREDQLTPGSDGEWTRGALS